MTVNEYREEILEKINSADTTMEVDDILDEARSVLDASNLSSLTVRRFWTDLYDAVSSGRGRRLLKEAQAAAALNALVQHALSAIANLSALYAAKS
jgi:hypothetical protein